MSYRIEAVQSSRSQAFDEAFQALFAEFAPRGELERRAVVAAWVDENTGDSRGRNDTIERTYHLLVARDESGALAGVRDCHVIVERRSRVAVVYLAHVLVLPGHRRTGLAGSLRRAPIALANAAIEQAENAGSFELLLAAEMEPADPEDPKSLIRLIAYGKDGFGAITPDAFPYFQPDFRDLGADVLAEAAPLPLLPVVRRVGHEQAAALPKKLARAILLHLFVVFATHVDRRQLDVLERHTLRCLDDYPEDEVPLLALPRSLDDHERIAPLARSHRHSLPASLLGGSS